MEILLGMLDDVIEELEELAADDELELDYQTMLDLRERMRTVNSMVDDVTTVAMKVPS